MRPLISFAFALLLAHCQPITAQTQRSLQERFGTHAVTIRGTARNHEGQPIAGAKIGLLCTNRIRPGDLDSVVGQVVTDDTGAYVFRNVPLPILGPDGGPIRKYSEGSFQVFGTASGYGFTWHAEQFLRVIARPEENDAGPAVFFLGEECVADLAFDLPATVSGQLTDDRGQPLANVKVELGYVRDLRRPNGLASSHCTYLGPPDAPGNPPRDNFSGMGQLPEEHRQATTDRHGRYKLIGLRRETVYSVLIDYRPEVDPLSLTIATTSGSKGRAERQLGHDARLDHRFAVPPAITVHVSAADSASGLANVTVRARRKRLLRGGNVAKTDASGMAVLHLPSDEYTLILEPPVGAPYLSRETNLVVTGKTREQSAKAALDAAATLLITAADTETGQPLGDVSFLLERGAGAVRHSLHSQTVIADYPVTDDQGQLRTNLPPERVRVVVDKSPPGYEPVRTASDPLAIMTGQTHAARFEFRKTAAPVAPEASAAPEELTELHKLIEKQRVLSRSGTYQIRQTIVSSPSRTPAELRKLVNDWNADTDPDLFDVMRQQVAATASPASRVKVIIHGDKQRNESEYVTASGDRVVRISVSNGHENVVLDAANGQASLTPAIVGTTPQRFGPMPSMFLPWPSAASARANRPGFPPPQVSRQTGKLIVERGTPPSSREVIDEATGSLQHSWSQVGTGFGRESWYFSPRRFDSGLLLAGLTIQCQFNGDKLTMLQVLQLEGASLQIPPPESFVVSAPAGTNIVDFRENRQQPKSEVISYPVADVIIVANRISDRSRSILPVLKVGDPAPPLDPAAWLNFAGRTAPPDPIGKVVLIDFWGIHCGPCVAELPDVQLLAKEFAGENFLLIGLHESSGELEGVAKFAREQKLSYQLAIDRPAADSLGFGAIYKAYGIHGIPNCAVIDQQGRLAYLGRFPEAARAAARLLGKESNEAGQSQADKLRR